MAGIPELFEPPAEDRGGDGASPQPAEVLLGGFLARGGLDLLQDAGNRHEEGRAQHGEGGHDLRRLGEVRDAHAARDADELQAAREHMGEREEDDRVALRVHHFAVRAAAMLST